jgi:hypothetical protein
MQSMANTTFWDKLVGDLAPRYRFSVIPFPTKAKVVPFIGGLRTPWTPWGPWSIQARDMSMQDTNAHLPRALRAVGLFSGIGDSTGSDLADDVNIQKSIGGWYMPQGAKTGMVLLQNAPKYLSQFNVPAAWAGDALAKEDNKVRGNAHNHPGAGVAPNNMGKDVRPGDIQKKAKTLLDKLAHATYVEEILKNRWGDIHGPLRFDISPGSIIRFEGTSGDNQPGAAGEANYGAVQRVSYMIDAQHQKATTSFRLTHIRTEAENQSDLTSVARHPLYKNVWSGDYMLDANIPCPGF